jgi:hypothetical protein
VKSSRSPSGAAVSIEFLKRKLVERLVALRAGKQQQNIIFLLRYVLLVSKPGGLAEHAFINQMGLRFGVTARANVPDNVDKVAGLFVYGSTTQSAHFQTVTNFRF